MVLCLHSIHPLPSYPLIFPSYSTHPHSEWRGTHHISVITGRCGVVCSLTAHVTLLMRLKSWHLDDSQPSALKYLWRLLCSIPGLLCSPLLVYICIFPFQRLWVYRFFYILENVGSQSFGSHWCPLLLFFVCFFFIQWTSMGTETVWKPASSFKIHRRKSYNFETT